MADVTKKTAGKKAAAANVTKKTVEKKATIFLVPPAPKNTATLKTDLTAIMNLPEHVSHPGLKRKVTRLDNCADEDCVEYVYGRKSERHEIQKYVT